MIHRPIDSELNALRQKLLDLGTCVEQAVEESILAWENRDTLSIQRVYDTEAQVNQIHKEIDAICFTILATLAPLANELRLVLGVLKINADLEGMVDQAVNIGNNTEFFIKLPTIGVVKALEEMAEAVKLMVHDCLIAFVNADDALAKNVISHDDQVDHYKNQIFKQVLSHIKGKPTDIEQGLNVILIARNLERIGDYATHVAEDVIFTISGDDVRHFPKVPKTV